MRHRRAMRQHCEMAAPWPLPPTLRRSKSDSFLGFCCRVGNQRMMTARDPDRTSSENLFCIARLLFDHLVGGEEDAERHVDPERLRRLAVDDEPTPLRRRGGS